MIREYFLIKTSISRLQADYAMKYKAGIVPPRQSQKMSEYQREFEWKQGIKSSPLLAAQDVRTVWNVLSFQSDRVKYTLFNSDHT